jgi:hypothetical protein
MSWILVREGERMRNMIVILFKDLRTIKLHYYDTTKRMHNLFHSFCGIIVQ